LILSLGDNYALLSVIDNLRYDPYFRDSWSVLLQSVFVVDPSASHLSAVFPNRDLSREEIC
jgi:hypothetical protein